MPAPSAPADSIQAADVVRFLGGLFPNMPRVFIIAYGNPLRSDDGVAWRAAEELQRKFPTDDVEIVTLHQLGPELAESASRSACVIFIDAAAGPGRPGEVQVKELLPGSSEASRFCHALSPAHVLSLAAQLYGARPRAFSATVVGETFDHGKSLSSVVEAAIPALLAGIEELAHKFENHKGH